MKPPTNKKNLLWSRIWGNVFLLSQSRTVTVRQLEKTLLRKFETCLLLISSNLSQLTLLCCESNLFASWKRKTNLKTFINLCCLSNVSFQGAPGKLNCKKMALTQFSNFRLTLSRVKLRLSRLTRQTLNGSYQMLWPKLVISRSLGLN